VTAAIIGPRLMHHLDGGLAALNVQIPDEHLKRIDALAPPATRS